MLPSWTVKKIVLYTFGAFILLFLVQWFTSPLVVTVNGVGTVTAPASSATLTFSVTATGDNTTDAINNIKGRVSRIKETLNSSGVNEAELYESQTAVYPTVNEQGATTGFTSTVSMGFKTEQVQNLDGMINTLYAQGAAVVTQPVLSADETGMLEDQAYDLAIADAKEEAAKIGGKNLKFIRKVVSIEQSDTPSSSTVSSKVEDAGVLKITKVVSVSYKMW